MLLTLKLELLHCNVCSIKFRSKHSSNTVLRLLRNLMEQSLCISVMPIGTNNWKAEPYSDKKIIIIFSLFLFLDARNHNH